MMPAFSAAIWARVSLQPAPQPDLDDRPLDALLGEPGKSQGGHDLKGGDVGDLADERLQPLDQAGHVVFGDEGAVDPDALAEGVQMGRGVERAAIARRPEDGFGHGGCGALALGAGDVDGTERLLGIAQQGQQVPDPLQIVELGCIGRQAAPFIVGKAVDIAQGVAIFHGLCHVRPPGFVTDRAGLGRRRSPILAQLGRNVKLGSPP